MHHCLNCTLTAENSNFLEVSWSTGVTSNEILLAKVLASLFQLIQESRKCVQGTLLSGRAITFPLISPLGLLTFFPFPLPLSRCVPLSLLPPRLFLEARWREGRRVQAEEDETRGEARRLGRSAPGAHSGGAGCTTTELRLPSLIYRHYVGQRWSIHLRLSSHKLKFIPAMVQPGERGREAVLCVVITYIWERGAFWHCFAYFN